MPNTERLLETAPAIDIPFPIRLAGLSMLLNGLGWAMHTVLISGSSLVGFALLTGAVAFVGLVALACSLRARAELRRTPVDRAMRPLVGVSLVVAVATLIAAALLFACIVIVLARV
jgi:hypothetical protein